MDLGSLDAVAKVGKTYEIRIHQHYNYDNDIKLVTHLAQVSAAFLLEYFRDQLNSIGRIEFLESHQDQNIKFQNFTAVIKVLCFFLKLIILVLVGGLTLKNLFLQLQTMVYCMIIQGMKITLINWENYLDVRITVMTALM